ncbi:MAG: hypothetical protein PF518_07280 [Spirochaetaceae bacterium]|jgi:RHS repeat-associated protein|nr:hypothetical protein [Spirochaetaceae bacterium]
MTDHGFYTGKKIDRDTGLYYFNARWYDPQLGRFITEDPIKDGINYYAYANNNPLRYTDPTGLKPIDSDKEEEKKSKDEEDRKERQQRYWEDRQKAEEARQKAEDAKKEAPELNAVIENAASVASIVSSGAEKATDVMGVQRQTLVAEAQAQKAAASRIRTSALDTAYMDDALNLLDASDDATKKSKTLFSQAAILGNQADNIKKIGLIGTLITATVYTAEAIMTGKS